MFGERREDPAIRERENDGIVLGVQFGVEGPLTEDSQELSVGQLDDPGESILVVDVPVDVDLIQFIKMIKQPGLYDPFLQTVFYALGHKALEFVFFREQRHVEKVQVFD